VAAVSARQSAPTRYQESVLGWCTNHFSARQGVEDDHMTLLHGRPHHWTARGVGPHRDVFGGPSSARAPRHLRRLGKVAALEPEVIRDRHEGEIMPRIA